VARTGHWELQFFYSPRAIRSDKGIHVEVTRQNYYAQAFRKALSEFEFDFETFHNTTSSNNRMVAIESSPRYLLNSDRIPDLILCVTPWVKMMAILRDPIVRVESQYRYLDETRRKLQKPMVDWETWIQDDLRLLHTVGVLNATTPQEEYLAWKIYVAPFEPDCGAGLVCDSVGTVFRSQPWNGSANRGRSCT
jgi:hypothetical protein